MLNQLIVTINGHIKDEDFTQAQQQLEAADKIYRSIEENVFITQDQLNSFYIKLRNARAEMP